MVPRNGLGKVKRDELQRKLAELAKRPPFGWQHCLIEQYWWQKPIVG
jgi:hypothetical protein